VQRHRHRSIRRHAKVRSLASPFDGNWLYWASRKGDYPGVSPHLAHLLKRQAGQCAYCGLFFEWESQIEIHHRDGNWRHNQLNNLHALHRHCHDQAHGAAHRSTHRTNDKDSPVEEPCEVKVSRTVL
jgi:RNA-directed DNA polymerase